VSAKPWRYQTRFRYIVPKLLETMKFTSTGCGGIPNAPEDLTAISGQPLKGTFRKNG